MDATTTEFVLVVLLLAHVKVANVITTMNTVIGQVTLVIGVPIGIIPWIPCVIHRHVRTK